MTTLTISQGSFLAVNIAALPKSCQDSYSRIGCCRCRFCTGTAVPPPSSAASSASRSSSRIGSKLRGVFQHSKDNSSTATSTSSVNASSSSIERTVMEEDIDTTELHLLKILPAIEKLALERDLKEVEGAGWPEPDEVSERGTKRKTRCSSVVDDKMDLTNEEATVFHEEIGGLIRSQQRKKLVPSSRIKKQKEWEEMVRWLEDDSDGKVVRPWVRLKEKAKEEVVKGWRKCRRVIR